MIIRRTNTQLLREWASATGDMAKPKLALRAGISVSVIDKLFAGSYPSVPRERLRKSLCEATGYPEDLLFPVISGKLTKAS